MISPGLFRQHLLSVGMVLFPPKVLVAVSGGVDSMGLTYLLSKYRDTYQPDLDINAITVDHRYRPESSEEAKEVGNLLRQWKVNHVITPLVYHQNVHSITNFEEVARTMRYEQFHKLCRRLGINTLLVAHTRDDQVETFLQRLSNNSCLHGLQGLSSKANLPLSQVDPYDIIMVHRPLLDVPKSKVIETCKKNGVQWFEDVTNTDTSLTVRNHHRKLLESVTSQNEVVSPDQLLRSCNSARNICSKIDSQTAVLEQELWLQKKLSVDHTVGKMQLKWPKQNDPSSAADETALVLSRLLWRLLEPLSSVKYYYWSYAKIERRIVPAILAHDKGTLTQLNLLITWTTQNGVTTIKFSRQPISQDDIPKINQKLLLLWTLFDRRYWIRIDDGPDNVSVTPFTFDWTKAIRKKFPEFKFKPSHLHGVPIIVGGDPNSTEVLALPTLGLVDRSLDVEWTTK